jgi:hypothetical protein
MFTRPQLILRINKLEKKRDNCKNYGKNNKQISKIQKTQKQKSKGKKGGKKESQKGKKWGTNGLVHLHVFCFLDLFSFCFYFAFSLLFTGKKAKQNGK